MNERSTLVAGARNRIANPLWKSGVIALMFWTLAVTVLRALRTPNDFAEAHWLMDYRFGFVKRGLIGQVLSPVLGQVSIPFAERFILVISGFIFLVFCFVIIVMSIRFIHKSEWSSGSVLVSLVFLSSPFVVMSAHIIGYYDNIVFMLGVLSVVLLIKSKIWPAACLQVIGILVHENSVLINFPLFCLTWLLVSIKRRQLGGARLAFIPLLMPIIVFFIIAIRPVPQGFAELFADHLSQFTFIEKDRNTMAPIWISRTFLDYYSSEGDQFIKRLLAPSMHGLALPSALTIMCFSVNAFRIRDLSTESILLFAVCFAPQAMHLVAWDTPRIWTYTILLAFIALWIYSEVFNSREDSSAIRLLCLAALVANALVVVRLLERGYTDHFNYKTRLLLYAPTIIGSVIVIIYGSGVPIAERLTIRGRSIAEMLRLAGRRGLPGSAHDVEEREGGHVHRDDFRRHFETAYGTSGRDYLTYEPAYRYGYGARGDRRYAGRSYDDVERDLQSDYEGRYGRGAWEDMREAVRAGWERAKDVAG